MTSIAIASLSVGAFALGFAAGAVRQWAWMRTQRARALDFDRMTLPTWPRRRV